MHICLPLAPPVPKVSGMADPDTEVDPAESKHGTIAANIQEAAKEVAREANKNLIMVRLSRLGVGGRQGVIARSGLPGLGGANDGGIAMTL